MLLEGFQGYLGPLLQNTTTIPAMDSFEPSQQAEIQLCADMMKDSWQGILSELSFFVIGKLDEELYANVLKAYQYFTSLCGLLQLREPRNAFLTSLCKLAVPIDPFRSIDLSQSASNNLPAMSDKNMSCLRSVLTIAQRLAAALDQESWLMILHTLRLADMVLFGGNEGVSEILNPASPSVSPISPMGNPPDIAKNQEANNVFAAFKGLFEHTQDLEWSALKSFVGALCKLTQTHVQVGDSEEPEDTDQGPDVVNVEKTRKKSVVAKKVSMSSTVFCFKLLV
jgi:hypothetical protein